MNDQMAERIAVALERIAVTNEQIVEVMAAVGHSNAMLIKAISEPDLEQETPEPQLFKTMDGA